MAVPKLKNIEKKGIFGWVDSISKWVAIKLNTDGSLVVDSKETTDLEAGDLEAVGTTVVEVTFSGVTQVILITSHPDNVGLIYGGKSDVTNAGLNAGFILQPGDAVELDYNDITNGVYVVSDTAAQQFLKMALL